VASFPSPPELLADFWNIWIILTRDLRMAFLAPFPAQLSKSLQLQAIKNN